MRPAAPHLNTIKGLSAVAADYDVFVFDQFGVLHDGIQRYPSVAAVLDGLRALGKRRLVLTNSGKRAAANARRLVEMGFAATDFDTVVSSGETAWAVIEADALGEPFRRGAKVCIVGKAGDDYGFDGLDLDFVADAEAADFLLILGSDAPARSLAEQTGALAAAAARGVPALCANPDVTMLTRFGPQPAPGAIAAGYAALGGPVRYLGKPYPDIYAEVMRHCPGIAPDRILAVGDSLAHDVVGARQAGMATALVRTGVSDGLSDDALTAAMDHLRVRPHVVMPKLMW